MPATRKRELTTPDLVLLSLLAERPLHGYQANAELERREVRDWAGVSRPQIYYSIEKLARFGLVRAYKVRASGIESRAAGPERRVFQTTALSWQARRGVFRQQIERRRKFLENELSREEATLRAIKKEVGHRFHEAVWMVSLIIQQFRGELRWLRKLECELPRRAAAKRTQ
jgi:DNA-binding PadR family transcriptional regulator